MKNGKMKKLVSGVLACAMVGSLLTTVGCGATDTSTSENASAIGSGDSSGAAGSAATTDAGENILKMGIYGGLDSLNPWSNGRITKDMVTYVLYETLASCQNGATDIDYILMKDYEKVDDYTFNVEIYDYITDAAGNNITASDILFSFNQYAANWATTLDSIEATGDYTVQIKLNTTAAGAFEYLVCKVPIASEQAYNDSPDQLATTSCGTMPYTVAGGSDYVNGTTIIARTTGTYWQTDESLIYPGSVKGADVIEFDILEEPTQMALAIEQGNIDIAMYVDTSLLDEIADYDTLGLVEMPSSEDRGIMFCMTDDSPFANDLALRQAVLYAIDNESVAEACGYGYGKASDVTCGSEELTVGFSDAWKTSPYSYDPEKAQELLAQSNYDGTSLRLLCNSNGTITTMWQVIQANLLAVGINAELNVCEGTTYGGYRDGTSGQYEMAYAGPGNGGYVTADLWNTLFNRNNYESGRTWAGLLDDELQSLYDAIAAPDGYTQENLDAFYNYITDNALYYKVYDLSEFAAYNKDVVEDYYLDWNRFIRANTIVINK
jgi:ABC-type transport system substrate-binding protein